MLRTLEGKISLYDYYIRVEDDQGKEMTIAQNGNTEVSLDFDGTKINTEIFAVKDGTEYLRLASQKVIFA